MSNLEADKVKMREMLRCLICGRNSWPTSIGRGQKHGHQIDTLVLATRKGHKGFLWTKKNRARDRSYLIMWRDLLMAHLDRIEAILETLGETFVDAPPETVLPELIRQTKLAIQPTIFRKPWSAVLPPRVILPPQVHYGA